MAKRFTDTDKWKREWFCDLKPNAKLVWFYLLDQCDNRGVWFRNFRLMSEQVGFKVTDQHLVDWFGEKLRPFDGDKYFIPSFVSFQYGSLNPANNAHKPVIALVEMIEKLGPQEPLESPLLGAQDKDKDKEQDKVSVFKGGLGEKNILRSQIERAYTELYPLKKGKTKGIEAILKGWRAEDTIVGLIDAITRYRDDVKASRTEKKYIKHFSTFASEWRDWMSPDAGTASVVSKNYQNERDTDHDAEIEKLWGAG